MKNFTDALKDKRKTPLFFMIACALLCFSMSAALIIGLAANAELVGAELSESYSVGTDIEIPNGQISVNGELCDANYKVYLPDGTVSNADRLTLNETGKYVVEYSAEKDGRIYTETKSFFVYEYLLFNSGTKEPAKYKHNSVYNADGVHFSLRPSEKLVYSKAIDLTEYGVNDQMIVVDAIPDEPGTPEARDLYILLTDAYDETNYITIRVRRAPSIEDQSYSYITVANAGNTMTGYDSVGGLFVGHPNYGSGFHNGLQGNWNITDHIDLRLDYENKVLYNYSASSGILRVVADFNAHFTDNKWQGFTTGEAKLTIWADTYATTNVQLPFNGIILSLDGQDFSVGADEDSGILYKVDSVNAPIVDFGEYENAFNVPKAMVGFKYKVFDSKINSLFGNEQTYTRVYYGYTTSTRYEVPIINGYFTPDNEGVYTLVYTVVDRFGNRADTNVDVYAYPDKVKGLDVTVPGYENYKNGVVGEKFTLVPVSGVVTKGNLGNVTVCITAFNVQSGTAVDATCGWFIPTQQGAWKITYSSVDYNGRVGAFTYTADIVVGDGVIFGEMKNALNYFIVDAQNPIPELTYIDYNAGVQPQKVSKIYVERDGNKIADITDGFYTPTEAGVLDLVFEATSAKNFVSTYKKQVIAVDVGFKDHTAFSMANYFYSEGIVSRGNMEKSVSFVAKENSVVDFIRPVDAVNFSLSFNISETINSASAISVYLQDINDAKQTVKFTFADSNGLVTLIVNDATEYKLGGYRFGGGADFNMSFKTKQLSIGSINVAVKEFLNGGSFDGFESMLVNLTFVPESAEGETGNTEIFVNEITGQKFYDAKEDGDMILPRIVSADSVKGRVLLGDTVKISRARVIDVIDPYATATLTVQDKFGNAIRDIDGTELKNVDIGRDYYVKISEAGSYNVLYYYADSTNSLARPRGSMFQAVSRVKPEIVISGGATTAKVNQAFKVGAATVNTISTNYDIRVYVLGSIGNMKPVDMEIGEYTATTAGVYTVRYFVIDEWGNIAVAEYTVNVN